MKFTPKLAGQYQGYTYDTVKEHILQEIQRNLENGEDLADNLREGTDHGIKRSKPNRHLAPKQEITEPVTEIKRMEAAEERRIIQEGLDIEYKVELEKHSEREKIYEMNKYKAFTIIYNYCNQTMKNRIEELKNYEQDIRNNPF